MAISQWDTSIKIGDTWTEGGTTFTELVQQPYQDCVFAAGAVVGHPVEKVYLRWERPDNQGGMLMLRLDEGAAIAHLISGALWSVLSAGESPKGKARR